MARILPEYGLHLDRLVVNVDTISGKTTAGSISITGEGNSTTTNLQQGLIKAWAETNAAGTVRNDSFNIASLLDTDTGIQTCTYTNDFASGNYSVVTTGGSVGSNNTFSATNASNWIVYSFDGSNYGDMQMSTIASGDLA